MKEHRDYFNKLCTFSSKRIEYVTMHHAELIRIAEVVVHAQPSRSAASLLQKCLSNRTNKYFFFWKGNVSLQIGWGFRV
jgi:hypothetical protein